MTTAAYSQGVARFYDLFEGDVGRADESLALVQRHTLVEHAAQHLASGGCLLLDVAVDGSERSEQPRTLAAECRIGETLVRKHVTMRRMGTGRWLTTWELQTLRGEAVIDTCTRVLRLAADGADRSRGDVGPARAGDRAALRR